MKKEGLVISKDIIKRKKFLKNELKMILFKSILKNFQIKNTIRIEIQRKINIQPKKWKISTQNNVCIRTGRFGGVFKNWNISRHFLKNLAKYNLLTNVQMKSQ